MKINLIDNSVLRRHREDETTTKQQNNINKNNRKITDETSMIIYNAINSAKSQLQPY